MPCGGIYPIKDSWVEPYCNIGDCFQCNKQTDVNDLWVEEWDAPIHKNCVDDFLKTEEGKIILDHKHEVIRE